MESHPNSRWEFMLRRQAVADVNTDDISFPAKVTQHILMHVYTTEYPCATMNEDQEVIWAIAHSAAVCAASII